MHKIIFLFAVYSFSGWMIEVVYRSITQKRFINAGFLYGPFIPLYGFGAFFVLLLEYLFADYSIFLKLILYGIMLTSVEYSASFIIEKIFKLKLWDYSQNRFNIGGRVCLSFSLAWTVLALIFIKFIHPVVKDVIESIDTTFAQIFFVPFLAYIFLDLAFSIGTLTDFRKKISYLYSEYFNLSNIEIEKIFDTFKRLRSAFPYLNGYIAKKINFGFKDKLDGFLNKIQETIVSELNGRKPFEEEFQLSISDIAGHEEFLKLKDYFHHDSSIYDHVVKVSYLSYRICKYLKLDYRSAARGGMLHDFFLYDWRNHDVPDLPKKEFHGIEHPRIALVNATKYFTLNEIEKDIIVKHMWPLTLAPPKFKESFVVSFADKYLSSREFISEARKRQKIKTI